MHALLQELLQLLLLVCPLWLISAGGTSSSSSSSYRYLRALPASGVYQPGGVYSEYLRAMRLKSNLEIDTETGRVKADRGSLPSFFLAPTKLVAETITDEIDESECDVDDDAAAASLSGGTDPYCRSILRGIVPVPIRSGARDDIASSLTAALSASSPSSSSSGSGYSWKGAVITDRDRGIYDSLAPLYQKWLNVPTGGKLVYDKMKNSGSAQAERSPYHCFLSTIEATLGLRVTGLLLEVADTPNAASLSLGAACLLAKKDCAKEWVLTKNNYKQLLADAAKSASPCKILDCHLDEAFGLHLATQIPFVISTSLYNRISLDGLLEKRPDESMVISAPFFESSQQGQAWNEQLETSRARAPKAVPKVSNITDATTFLKMRVSEKRACLRASGVVALPRPREGPRKVDAVMIPLLDEEVAYEVLRRLGECRGDFAMAAEMEDFETRKPALAKQINLATKAGHTQLSRQLVEEFNSLATLRFDPEHPEEMGTFCIETWYWEARKRVYGIIAA